ncbi:MAG: hypothetical protein KDC38_13840, partial [Planctomycetes bacterium]|nr:hypothetical protein [Planctomycetota bacterium]
RPFCLPGYPPLLVVRTRNADEVAASTEPSTRRSAVPIDRPAPDVPIARRIQSPGVLVPSQIAAVARNTFLESIRQPITLVLLLLTLGLLTLNPALSSYTLEDDDRLLRDIALSTVFVGGLFLAGFTGAAALSEEIRTRTVLSVVSKPLARPSFLIGKYLGAFGAVAAIESIWALGLLFSLRHGTLMSVRDPYHEPVLYFGFGALACALLFALFANYFRGASFGSALTVLLAVLLAIALIPAFSFDARWQRVPFLDQFDPTLLAALFLVLQAHAVLCAVSIAAATRLGRSTTLIITTLFFLAGLTSEYFLGNLIDGSWIARASYALLPNLQYLWLGDALLEGRTVSPSYLVLVSVYCGLFVIGALGVATALFQSRDVG